jgi:hypothetical protein
LFDVVCAVVIISNAGVIAYTCEKEIKHALKNPGGPKAADENTVKNMNLFFFGFYCCELLLKLWAEGSRFFVGPEKKWNLFDLTLVVTASWDVVTEYAPFMSSGGGMNVTWLRLLRLLKMLKMLRVVRVLKFFQTLRMMMSSIMGSFVTLFWSMLMLFLMMFIFGLCFVQSLSSYLTDNPADNIPDETIEGIAEFWGSVPLATLTLYEAITGGNDWSPLAKPIKEGPGLMYHSLFIFYIAFSTIAVLNVLTGMFVDAAMKVAEEDQNSVCDQLFEGEGGEEGIGAQFKEFFLDLKHPGGEYVDDDEILHITWTEIEEHLEDEPVKNFFEKLDLTKEEAKKVYQILHSCQDTVEMSTYITGCLRFKDGTKGIDIVALMNDVKKITRLLELLIGHTETHFDHIHDHFGAFGARKPDYISVRQQCTVEKLSTAKDVMLDK